MEKMMKRLLSFVVALFLVLGMVPFGAIAAELATVAQTMDAEGNVVGTYATFEEALAAACANDAVTRLEILADCQQSTVANTENYNDVCQDLTIGAPAGESYTVTVKPAGDSIAIRVKDGGSLTIEENVTINHLDVVANGFATTGENMTINGELHAISLKQWTSNGTITVGETGKVVLGYSDGQFDLAYGNGTVTINGTGDKTETQFKAGYSGTRGNGNTLNLNDTCFEAGAWFTVAGSNGKINANNSVLKVSGGRMTVSSSGNTINLTNGSLLQVAGVLTLGSDNELKLDATSKAIAKEIVGDGKIVVDATGAADGAQLIAADLSAFTGTIEVIGAEYNAEDLASGLIVSVPFTAPALPTATVTELNAEELDLTFAMNFTADEATDEQLEYYGAWPADYILTSNKDIVFNNDGSADGWLGGQYTAWSENWITVPMGESVTLPANTPVRVMETAMALMGYTTALTYADIYSLVKSFNCGLYLDEEFLAANPDLEVTLELRAYNPADETENYLIGETYVFTLEQEEAPELPTATVTELDAEELDLTFAMNFTADEVTDEQLEYYRAWPADYILTSNKDIVFNNNGSGDGWLGGQYTAFSENWITVPMDETVTLPANTPVRVMETAMALMGYTTALTYFDIYDFVKSFNCGLYLDEEFLAANPDIEVTLELRMYNPDNAEESYVIGETYVFTLGETEAPALPTATATEIENDELTFAMNFKADPATAEQLNFYGSWYADFVLTTNKNVTFNADGGADGYLSGQYDKWSENWVDVPYGKGNVTLAAGEELQIMKFASELMGKKGLRYTYKEVYEVVKDFDCGVFFEQAFLDANPDLEVTLELRIYNPADETETYKIGDTYVFYLGTPALPTATATEIENDRLTFAMNFKADPATAAQLHYYGPWYADFVLTTNKDVTFNADGGADGFLSGQYDSWSENWVDVPYGKGNVTLAAGEELQIMKFAAELMGKKGLRYTYQEVYDRVKDFDCGVFFEQAFLDANPDLVVTLELRAYNPANEAENYKIGDTYVFTLSDVVAENVQTGKQYATVAAALAESVEGQTVRLLKNVTEAKAESLVLILNDRTLDLNGYTLEAANVVAVTGGAKIMDNANGEGLLKVAKTNLTLPSNDQLPIWSAEDAGYRFTNLEMDNWEAAKNAEYLSLMYWFTGSLDGAMKHHLTKVADNELKVVLRVSYKSTDGSDAFLDIVVPEAKVLEYANTDFEPYFLTTIYGLNTLGNATITNYVISGDVAVSSVSYTYTAITE